MNSPLLIRHPAPHPTESLAGYVLRLSQVNGYSTPLSLYRLAGMNKSERTWPNFAYAKLAAVANQPVSEIERIAFTHPVNDPTAIALLGKTIDSKEMNRSGAKVCPACVASCGFIEAHWHLNLMVGCPVHKQAAVWFCGGCKKRVSWLRMGLLTCKCGGPLCTPPDYLFREEDWWLLDCIRRRALGDLTHPQANPRMPDALVANTTLSQLISGVRILGKARMTASFNPGIQLGKAVVKAAASVLVDWPDNIHKLFRDLEHRGAPHVECDIQADLVNICGTVERTSWLRYG
jgi:TniQ